MTAEQAKRHLVRQDGEPSTGYVSAFDVASSIDQVYGDMALIVPPDAGTLDGLTDVEVPDPDVGDVLTWGGTSWGAESPSTVGVPLQVQPASGGNDTVMLQQALDDAATLVGSSRAVAVVRLWPGQTYSVNATLTLPSQVILDGAGSVISLASASNCDVIRSENFATLTGTNTWFVSDGVPSGFGLVDLAIDGNKSGQSGLGNGVAFYGKHYLIRNVVIDDCKGNGLYSECACFAGGQESWLDVPEAEIHRLRTQKCDGHGVHFKGPHDAQFVSLFTNGNGGDGYRSETLYPTSGPNNTPGNYYNGSADIAFLHSFYNGGVGVRIGAMTSISECSTESNFSEGLIVEAWDKVRVHGLMAYRNHLSSPASQVDHSHASVIVQHGPHTFGSMEINTQFGGTGLSVEGAGNTFGQVAVDGTMEGGTADGGGRGISIAADDTRIAAAYCRDFSGTGGVGLEIANALENVTVNATLRDCKTYLKLPTNGTGNRIRLNVDAYVGPSQTGMTGSMTGRGNELSRHLYGAGSGIVNDASQTVWSATDTLAHDGTWYYVTVGIPTWVASVATSRIVVTASVAAAASGLPAGQELRVHSIDAAANTAKILWTLPFGGEPTGADAGDTVSVNYTIMLIDAFDN